MEAALFVVFAIAAVVVAYLISQAAREKRRQGWMALGTHLGLTYSPGDDRIETLPFDLLQRGDGRGIDHVLSGEHDGVDVRIFEFWYYVTTYNGKTTTRTYHRFTCALAQVGLDAPHITIDREGFLSRVADHMGFRDIEFESEEFNRAMNIRCGDRRFASYLIDARMMEYLLPLDGWSFEVYGNRTLASCGRLAPADVDQALAAVLSFREKIPRAATDSYGRDSR